MELRSSRLRLWAGNLLHTSRFLDFSMGCGVICGQLRETMVSYNLLLPLTFVERIRNKVKKKSKKRDRGGPDESTRSFALSDLAPYMRMVAVLRREGRAVNRKRMRRLMRVMELEGREAIDRYGPPEPAGLSLQPPRFLQTTRSISGERKSVVPTLATTASRDFAKSSPSLRRRRSIGVRLGCGLSTTAGAASRYNRRGRCAKKEPCEFGWIGLPGGPPRLEASERSKIERNATGWRRETEVG